MTDCMRGSIGALAEQPVVFEGEQPGRVLELAGHAGVLLLANGAEIFRVQETMIRLLRAFGVTNSNVYVISNGIFATVNEGSAQALSLVRHVPLGSVNLARIDQVNQISRSVCAGELGLEAAEAALTQAETFMPEGLAMLVLASALGAAAFCCLFGGTLADGATAFFVGVALQLALFGLQRCSRGFMLYILGSALVTLLSGAASWLLPSLHFNRVVIGGIIPLVPGVSFTTSIREFFNGDYLSGVIHLIAAVLTAVCIALGVCGGIFVLRWLGGVLQ